MSDRGTASWGRGRTGSASEDGNPLLALYREVNRTVDEFLRGIDLPVFGRGGAGAWPRVDVAETETEVRVVAELPGMDEKDVEVTLHDGVLTLAGEKKTESEGAVRRERWFGAFRRAIELDPRYAPAHQWYAFQLASQKHFDEALIFTGQQGPDTVWLGCYTLASRTPLFNLTAASVMSLAGSDFAVFQLASVLLSCVFVLPLYLLLRNLFDRRAGYLAVLLAALNVWLMHNAWFTWPKMLAAYYMLLGLHFYLQAVRCRERETAVASRYYLYAVSCAALGYMTHQVALVYFLPLLLHAALLGLRNRAFRPRPTEVAGSMLAVTFVLAPWYGWLMLEFGLRQIMSVTPATAMNPRSPTAPSRSPDGSPRCGPIRLRAPPKCPISRCATSASGAITSATRVSRCIRRSISTAGANIRTPAATRTRAISTRSPRWPTR